MGKARVPEEIIIHDRNLLILESGKTIWSFWSQTFVEILTATENVLTNFLQTYFNFSSKLKIEADLYNSSTPKHK